MNREIIEGKLRGEHQQSPGGCSKLCHGRSVIDMPKMSVAAVMAALMVLYTSQSFAGTTGWFNYSDAKTRTKVMRSANRKAGPHTGYQRIQCRVKDGNIWVKLHYSPVFSDGFYGYILGPTNTVSRDFAPHKKRGARVTSRTNLKFRGGGFTCMTWHRGG